ncbi:acyl carrier protein [Streptomyces sp. H27-D2]|uniref:acyl carrier protein n=1 Tax=Streptomyces sp. H27-D2 TaxID=3046304 RepID=UPI002DB64396|nr:acyl carrier protein [Streptomyces sp. H27-D2]MEC4019930.1 acyl carrier protein [Streptomyces sp. H27-D2]
MASDTILAEITRMLVEVVGDELLLEGEIGMTTSFSDDLVLESIEFVALAELLQRRYGTAVDLMGFLAGKDMEEILSMSVGDLVDHIAARPASPCPPSPSAVSSVA